MYHLREVLRSSRRSCLGAALILVFAAGQVWSQSGHEGRYKGRWMAGDFHTHTFLTDGDHTQSDVVAHAFGGSYHANGTAVSVPGFGLDWMANSEHGGAYARNPQGLNWPAGTTFLGDPPAGNMWRWQSLRDYSYPLISLLRGVYPRKVIVQGYEWNVPTHEHASVGIVGASEAAGSAIARYEYLFDGSDAGTTSDSFLGVTGKVAANSHAKAVAGAGWLQNNYQQSSYFLLNHPSRRLRYSVADIRDFNNAAPDVAFGFEGLPGHQKEPYRGGYGNDLGANTYKARTYGGADYMVAKVGGLWDSLLGEGRHFWTFVNSDFHSSTADADFYPGEYAKSYTFVVDREDDGRYSPEELVAGLRSGNSFAVHGDLINVLEFTAQSGDSEAAMGQDLELSRPGNLKIKIRFKSPAVNAHGNHVRIDHIDLIAGEITGRVSPDDPAYSADTNPTTGVIAAFRPSDWETEEGGWSTIVYHLSGVDKNTYFRLRGTNLAPDTANETDAAGNPLVDVDNANTEAAAWADLWFYSNPIFVYRNVHEQ